MSQTRPQRNRRPLNVRNQCQPPLAIVVGVGTSDGLRIEAVLDTAMFGPCAAGFSIYVPGSTATDITYSTDGDLTVYVDLNVALSPGDYVLKVEPYSPIFRNSAGGYIAPGEFPFTVDSP